MAIYASINVYKRIHTDFYCKILKGIIILIYGHSFCVAVFFLSAGPSSSYHIIHSLFFFVLFFYNNNILLLFII